MTAPTNNVETIIPRKIIKAKILPSFSKIH
jgi:hypothetical protein